MVSKKQYHYPYDAYKKKIELLQDFMNARGESSSSLYSRFGVIPVSNGKRLMLRNGIFKYSEESIDKLLKIFQKAYDDISGIRLKTRKPI